MQKVFSYQNIIEIEMHNRKLFGEIPKYLEILKNIFKTIDQIKYHSEDYIKWIECEENTVHTGGN